MRKPVYFRLLLLVTCLSWPATVLANRLVGEAMFSVFWFDIYQAKLYHPSGQFSFAQLAHTRLELHYQRAIEASDLIDKTRSQWQQLGIAMNEQHRAWLQQLQQLWPEIEAGDSLAFEVTAKGEGRFEFKSKGGAYRYLGTITERQFCHDFLAIWLANQAEHRQFTEQLLGQGSQQ